MMQQNITPFILTQKQKPLLMKATLMMYLNRSIVRVIPNVQKSFGKILCCIIDSVVDHTITISKYSPLTGSTYQKS